MDSRIILFIATGETYTVREFVERELLLLKNIKFDGKAK